MSDILGIIASLERFGFIDQFFRLVEIWRHSGQNCSDQGEFLANVSVNKLTICWISFIAELFIGNAKFELNIKTLKSHLRLTNVFLCLTSNKKCLGGLQIHLIYSKLICSFLIFFHNCLFEFFVISLEFSSFFHDSHIFCFLSEDQ